jgi:hypothetical protein
MAESWIQMQTIIQVFSKGSKSLRDRVVKDKKQLKQFGLVVFQQKRQGRPHGWAKLHMNDHNGAINMEWHAASQMLICRVVTRGGKPHDIAGAFITFLLARFSKQIAAVHILPQI